MAKHAFPGRRKSSAKKFIGKSPKKMEGKDQQRHAFATIAVLKKEFLNGFKSYKTRNKNEWIVYYFRKESIAGFIFRNNMVFGLRL